MTETILPKNVLKIDIQVDQKIIDILATMEEKFAREFIEFHNKALRDDEKKQFSFLINFLKSMEEFHNILFKQCQAFEHAQTKKQTPEAEAYPILIRSLHIMLDALDRYKQEVHEFFIQIMNDIAINHEDAAILFEKVYAILEKQYNIFKDAEKEAIFQLKELI